MNRLLTAACFAVGLAGLATPAAAQSPSGGRADPQFLGIDLDNGSIYYNGRNSGRYCVYRTVRVFNRWSGYYENRRTRSCGRGLYFR